MDIDGGFLLVAVACLVLTVTASTDAAAAYGVVSPFGLGKIVRLRVGEMGVWARRVTVVGGAVVGVVAQLVMIAGVAGAVASRDAQRVAIAAVELASAGAWLVLLLRNERSRSTRRS
jgi:hypothetical protein